MDVMHVKSAVHEVGEQLAREMALSEKHLQAAKLAQNAGLKRRLAEVVDLNDWRRSALQNNVPLNDSCFCRAARYLHDLANGKEKPVSHVQLQANQLVRACKFLFTYIFTSLHLAPWHLSPGSWQLAPGNWHLAPGSWQLAAGSWQLAPGTWLLARGAWLVAAGTWNLAAGRYQVPLQAARCQASGAACRVPCASCSHGLNELLEPLI